MVATIPVKRGSSAVPPRKRRILRPFLYAVVVLLAILYVVDGLPLRKAHAAWKGTHYKEALATLNQWAALRLRPAEYDEALAVMHLSMGNLDQARPFLDRASRRKADWLPSFDKKEVSDRLLATQRYEEFLAYDRSVHQRDEPSVLGLYRAVSLAGLNRVDEASKVLGTVPGNGVDPQKFKQVRAALDLRSSGVYPLILGRDGSTIASFDVKRNDLTADNRDFEPLIEKSAGSLTIESQLKRAGTGASIETTLDPLVQRSALAALGNLRGSIVAIDPATNEILAIASTHPWGPLSNLALEGDYEPGSVMKVLTSIDAAKTGLDFGKIFPMDCKGLLPIDGRQFRDWAVHGDLEGLEEALAVSCNTAFADIGVRLGRENLLGFLRLVGFDGKVDLGLMEVPLGKTTGSFYNRFEIANLAVGLEHERIHALHLAMLASMVANRGKFVSPKLIRGRRSILGEAVGQLAPQQEVQAAPREAVERVIPSMRAVVTDPRGTGRKVAVEGLSIAMKTGTAGKRETGYDALIMAFAPVESPRIAFGIIVERGGPAEHLAAGVAHDFLTRLHSRLQ